MKISILAALCLSALAAHGENWPTWRGPDGMGVSNEKNLPRRWSATENIRWKTPLPEAGNSSPIVWGNKVFITQAIESEGRRLLICFDCSTGRELWRQGPKFAEKEEKHDANDYAAASPVTDGERVIAFFGSAGLFCYDLDGRELWKRDLGRQSFEWGYASSPVIHGDLCVLYFGPGERSFLVAVDKKSGKTLWQANEPPITKRPRTDGFKGREDDGMICTYAVPVIARAGKREELIMVWPQQVRAYEPASGMELWRCDGLNELIYCSPIVANDVVVAMGGFFGTSLAVRAGGAGDVTSTHRLWQSVRTKNRLGSGVIHGDHVYVLNTEGIAECLELKSGKQVWSERVRGKAAKSDSWSSMVLAGDLIYVLNQSAETCVLRASPKFELLAVNPLETELTNSSMAASDGELFVRTHKNLWCISEKRAATASK